MIWWLFLFVVIVIVVWFFVLKIIVLFLNNWCVKLKLVFVWVSVLFVKLINGFVKGICVCDFLGEKFR